MVKNHKSSKRKVLYVVPRFPDVHTTFIANEMNVIQASGIDVHIFSIWPQRPGNKVNDLEIQFLVKHKSMNLGDPRLILRAIQQLIKHPQIIATIITLIMGHLLSIYSFAKILALIPVGLYLGHYTRKNGFDHIHAHFLSAPATVALLAAHSSGVSFSITAHAFDIFSTSPQLINGSKKFKLEESTVNVMISRYNHQYLLKQFSDINANFEIIYNGIDVSTFQNKSSQKTDTEFTRILSNGRLIPKKGHDYLIKAVHRLKEEGYKVSLSIIGDGHLENSLKDLVCELNLTDTVMFLGTMPQSKVIDYYCTCDIFALCCAISSDGDMDGIPTVLIEALACEIPAVSTNLSGIPELIRDGETGWCVEPHDVEAIVNALKEIINNPTEAKRRARAGRELVQQQFNREINAHQVVSTWNAF